MEAVVVEQIKNSLSTPVVDPIYKAIIVKDGKEAIHTSDTRQDVSNIDIEAIDFSKLVQKVTEVVQNIGTKVSFSYDDRSSSPIIRVTDDKTGEIIRQFPREEMLQLMSRLREVSGLIFQGSV